MNTAEPAPGHIDPASDTTEPSLSSPSPNHSANSDATEKSIADDPTEVSLGAPSPSPSAPTHPGEEVVQAGVRPDDPTEKSLSGDMKPSAARATMVKGGSATNLMAGANDTNQAASITPDQATHIPEADLASLEAPVYPNVPGFEILGTLGRGGMGVVYKARHKGLGRLVALKMILHGNLASKGDLARFRIEAEAIASLQHPNIVQIYEIGNYQGLPFFSLEFVDGGTLSQKLGGIPQPNLEAAQTVQTLARAMAFAHQRGIIHRDLKPANVLLTSDGSPKIVDFGLAKKLDALSARTHSGAVMGTPSYMAPEQADGSNKDIGPGVDIYALGAILYEMLTGRPPFRAEKPMDTLRMVIQDEPVRPARLNPGAAPDLETICLKCLQKEIAKRYASAQDLADDLHRFQEGAPITARPVTPTERAIKWIRRRPALAAVYALLIMVTVLGALGAISAWRWYETDLARREIASALAREQQALKGEAEAKAQLERLSYIHDINLAWRDWNGGEVSRARKLLEACPPSRRQWEWHFLHRQAFPELLTLADLADEPLQVLLVPGGMNLVIVSQDNQLHTREGRTGSELPLPFASGPVQHVVYRADGKLMAAAGTDQSVAIRDVATGKLVHTLHGHQGAVVHLAFSPDGARLASASADKTARIWEVATGRELFTLKGHASQVSWVAFRPDGRQLATASWDTTAKVWDLATGKEVTTPGINHAEALTQIAYAGDGKRLATACFDKTVKLWDCGTFRELPPLQGPMEDINQMAFSPDGKRLAFARRDKTINVFDLATGKRLFYLQGHLEAVTQVAYSPDGARIVSTGKDKTVKVWDAAGGKETVTLAGMIDNVNCLAYSPPGLKAPGRIAAAMDNAVRVWDAATGADICVCRGHSDKVISLAFSPSGQHLATAGKDNTVRIWDAATGKQLQVLTGHSAEVTQVAFSADGTRLASGGADRLVKVWDFGASLTSGGKELFSLDGLSGPVRQLVFHPKEPWLAVAVLDTPVQVWDTRTGQKLTTLSGHADNVTCLVFDAGGRRLASAGKDRGVRVWDAATGQELVFLKGHDGNVVQLAFSPDGDTLATGSLDKTAKLWDAGSGALLGTLEGHIAPVASVAFSPNGRRLATGSWDRTVKLWDVQTGKELLSLPSGDEVTAVLFSPDGNQLTTTSSGVIKIWEGRP
jgi:WD40 repeat protein/tRNA A-37 threonylcarbamoyl transferase component Bud32